MREIFADRTYTPPARPVRELVETAGHPYIKVVIADDDQVSISAQGIEQQNILPILSLIVKGLARAEEIPA